jgi:REP element-mobilizing transposase RayT
MPQSLSHLLIHVIFSTKNRAPYINSDLKPALHAYLGGIIRELDGKPVAINGAADHVHLLIVLPSKVSLADALRILKTNSSRWIHQKWLGKRSFAWQSGYSAFSVSESNAIQVIRYIAGQERQHKKLSFQGELRAFLKKHKISYDERYVWD